MSSQAARTTLAALSIFALGALGGCSSDPDDASTEDVRAEESSAPAQDPTVDEMTPTQDPVAEPEDAAVFRYGVGDSFTTGDEFFGFFDITFLGVADMGQLDDGSGEDIRCYAVLAEVTLQEMPAVNEDPEVGGVTHEVLDASGEKAADNYSSGCPDSILADNGYPSKYEVEWIPGTPVTTTIEKLTVPVDRFDSADSVDIDPLGEFVLDFVIVENW